MIKNILIVDDEQEVLDVISEMLDSLGYRPFAARRGSEALKLAKTKKFDLVITDLIMPDMGGLAFAKKFKKQQKDTPIIVTAGVNLGKSNVDLEKYGVSAFIRKPFFIEEIDSKIKQLFAGKRELINFFG
jgi:CheY-like chemotaxis protein